MSAHTDIRAAGWVARLPPGWRAYALLARLDRPIGAWLLFLPALWSILLARAPPWPTVRLLALFGLGAVLMRGAGCVVNDMWDRDMDRRVTRTAGRPLASGALRMRHAAACSWSALLAISLAHPPAARRRWRRRLGVASRWPWSPSIRWPSAMTWWPQAMLGVTFGWGAPMGYAAGGGAPRCGGAGCCMRAAFVWILGYDTDLCAPGPRGRRSDRRALARRACSRSSTRPFSLSASLCCTMRMLVALGGRAARGWSPWFYRRRSRWPAWPPRAASWRGWTSTIPRSCNSSVPRATARWGSPIGLAILLGPGFGA